MNVRRIYRSLTKEFGPQGWWPRHRGKRRPGFDARFEIIVGAILTQNTTWMNIEKVIETLYHAELLSADALKQVSITKLKRLIRSAGYFNQKAKKLKIIANYFLDLSKHTVPSREDLLALWGIGKETADSILLYAFNHPVFVIDAYTRRLCKMHGVEFKEYDEYRLFFESHLPRSAKLFNEYHALIVAWGKTHGKPARTPKQRATRGRYAS